MHDNADLLEHIEIQPAGNHQNLNLGGAVASSREAMMRNANTEDCVWIHPGVRLVGIAVVNEAASEIR
ncbi:MAG TPA: hypothetical protein VGG85_15740 [Terracidiphilus sp.]